MKKQKNSLYVLLLLITLYAILFLTQGKAESDTFPIGTVLGVGNAELESIQGKFIALDTNTYPLFSDSTLRTRDGKATVTLKDGGRMEIYKETEFSIHGGNGNYRINLNKGALAFSFPLRLSITIITSTATIETGRAGDIIQKVGYERENEIKGVILIDKKGNTQVVSISGEMMVKDIKGASQILTSGKSLYISTDPYRIIPVQAIGDTGGIPARVSEYEGIIPYLAGGVAIVTTGIIIDRLREKEGPASPYIP